MKYFQNLTQYTTENDPAGFKSPYLCGEFELEVVKSRYFKLTNYSKSPVCQRCNTIAYGGLTIRNEF
jgi:hypothetical protein